MNSLPGPPWWSKESKGPAVTHGLLVSNVVANKNIVTVSQGFGLNRMFSIFVVPEGSVGGDSM